MKPIPRPSSAAGRHHAADHRHRAGRHRGLLLLPVSPLPQVDFPTISVQATLPGASPRPWPPASPTPLERHLGQIADVTEMTSSSSVGSARITCSSASTATSTAPRATCRRRSTRARRPADQPAQQSDLPQGQPGRRADHDPGADLEHADPRPDLRRGLHRAAAEAVAGRPASARSTSAARSLPAVRVELNPAGAVQIRHRPGGRARGAGLRQRQQPQGRVIEVGRQRYQIYTNDQASRPPTTAAGRRLSQRRGGAAVRCRPRSSIRSRTCATLGLANGKPAWSVICTASPAPTSSTRSTREGALLPSCRPRSRRHRHHQVASTAPPPSAPRCTTSSAR
jgi:multidrug efflux pump